MKNLTIQLPFDETKFKALNTALLKKDTLLEDELERFLLGLYKRSVSKAVQEFLDEMAEEASRPATKSKTSGTA